MGATFFDLPAELRNRIYEGCFEIIYDVYSDADGKTPRFWSQPPKNLHLFLICKQIYEEASSLLYINLFNTFEFTAQSMYHLKLFCLKVPQKHRGNFRAIVRVTLPDLGLYLERIGLSDTLPWITTNSKQDDKVYSGRKTLRGDCFQATRDRCLRLRRGVLEQYDRLSIYGHLGRLEWIDDHFAKIRFRPPAND